MSLRRLKPSEDDEAIAFVQAFRRQWPEHAASLMHFANEYDYARVNGKLTGPAIGKAKKRERMGVLKGCSDYLLAVPWGGLHGLWIELKADGGSVKPDQMDFLEERDAYGYAACFAWGWRGAVRAVESYMSGRWEAGRVLAFTERDDGPFGDFTLTGKPRQRKPRAA